MLVCTKCQCPNDTSIGNNVGMMRVYILLAVAVVVLVIVAMCQFQDENRQHTSNAPSDKLAPKNGSADHALAPEVINLHFELTIAPSTLIPPQAFPNIVCS